MTTAQVVNDREGEQADWVVSARIMQGKHPGCEPTEAELRLATWILLDRGLAWLDIETRTIVPERMIVKVARLRKIAAESDRPRGSHGGLNPQAVRRLAPTTVERVQLYGVGITP